MNITEIIDLSTRINQIKIGPTDCPYTLDNMSDSISYIKRTLKGLSSQDMFEIILRLNGEGLKNMVTTFFPSWDDSHIDPWDYTKLIKSLDKLYTSYRNKKTEI